MSEFVECISYSKYIIDRTTMRILEIDKKFTSLLGYTKEDVENGLTLADIIPSTDHSEYFECLKNTAGNSGESYLRHRMLCKNGNDIAVFCYGKDFYSDKYNCEAAEIVITNVSELRRLQTEAETKLRAYNEMICKMFEKSDSELFEYNVAEDEFRITHLKNGFYNEIALHKHFLKNNTGISCVHQDDKDYVYDKLRRCSKSPMSDEVEFRVKKNDGSYRWYRADMVSEGGFGKNITNVIGRMYDINEEKLKRDRLEIMAETDSMTGLYNHRSFFEHAQKFIMENVDGFIAVYMIDIDNFKSINDALGHSVGDVLVQKCAKIIDSMGNVRISGRMGGDEFAMVTVIENQNDVKNIAGSICGKINEFQYGVSTSVSIGAVIKRCGNIDFEYMYHEADKALYMAKRSGKNKNVIWTI